jgi:glutamine amidotransferase
VIVIIDYGMGNLGSVQNMLSRIAVASRISSDPKIIRTADKLILPGVGAFDNGVKNLNERDLISALEERVKTDGVPILGICLGAQLLTRRSEEGSLAGLGWVDAETVRFRFPVGNDHLKVPHMGWKEVAITRDNRLVTGFEETPRFYFVHSYHIRCNNQADITATACHGIEFTAALCQGNVMGVQFHPEKSHRFGMRVLKNFVEMTR